MASIVLLVLLFVNVVGSNWVNKYDQPFTFKCPGGQSISRVASRHDNFYEDRQYAFSCQTTPGIGSCQWDGYANEWDQPFTFQCPGHGVISGIHSFHSDHYEDRLFKFYCCKLKSIKLDTCRFTGYVNFWDEYFNYRVPAGHVLRGAYSIHHNDREDRRWKFETCTLRRGVNENSSQVESFRLGKYFPGFLATGKNFQE